MVGSRLGWCVACLLAGCFEDISPGDGGASTDATSGVSSTGEDTTMGMPTSTSVGPGTTPTATSTTSASTEVETGPDSEPTTIGVSSDDPLTSGSSGSSGDCHTLDFEGMMLTCVVGDLALPIGPYHVTFTDALVPKPIVCVEDVGGPDMATAPLTGNYVYMQISPNDPAARLSFNAAVASLSFRFGPRHVEETAANTSICVTTMGSCDSTTAFANQDDAGMIDMDLAGGTEAFIYLTKGIAHIGIDDLHVCFEQ